MRVLNTKSIAFGAGIAWALMAGRVAADDIELFVANPTSTARPNVLFILDDSISMGADTLTQNNYDPSTTYPAGTCNASTSRVYWSTNGEPPGCGTSQYFDLSALVCQRAIDAFATLYGGTYTDLMAQYDDSTDIRWENISTFQKSRLVECEDDRPDASIGWAGHGDGSNPNAVYARNGNASQKWGNNQTQEISWGASPADRTYTLYSGNYMNWYDGTAVFMSRLAIMQQVANNIVTSTNGINVGMMHFNGNTGGLVEEAVDNIATNRASMISAITALTATETTPLEETLYEAYLYMTGGTPVNGGGSDPSAFDASGDYDSPIDLECQQNHIVILTDGEPRSDQGATSDIEALVDFDGNTFASLTGAATCDLETYPPGFVTGQGGDCLDELAEFMYKGDISPLPGQQNATVHTVGFLVDLPVLQQTASRGGGQYRTADDADALTAALTNIVTNILDTNGSFVAPSVSINSFNQTRNLDEIFFSVFKPTGTTHWPGNLKKYRLRASDATIVDAADQPAIVPDPMDPTRLVFDPNARSFWSATPDGADIEAGGAANLIPLAREVYTYLSTNPSPDADLTAAVNRVATGNALVDNTLLGTANATERTSLINFINGLDAADRDDDGIVNESRSQMGDPLHAQPVSLTYSSTRSQLYFATNDGYLHAIDADTGVEQWAFLPEEFLDDQIDFMADSAVGAGVKRYGVDGNLRLQIVGDNDGIVESGEKVMLFFGMRRGGNVYYGLDITDPDVPQLMWRLDGSSLPGSGQSWSSTTPTKINVMSSGQNSDYTVLVIGGGYDTGQDGYTTQVDTEGNSIYIVDSQTGALLWRGTKSGGDENFDTTNSNRDMDYSFPGDIRVIDLDGDQFADRMYAADMGGQVWRFDINNGSARADLVYGGVIAELGASHLNSPTLADTRRFYSAPDVALVANDDFNFLHIGIGSGYRAHPSETVNHNRFFALRDYLPFQPMDRTAYQNFAPVQDTDPLLIDVTNNLNAVVDDTKKGWKIDLVAGGGWVGEKVLAETRTFNNEVFVTTFEPGGATSCEPALGTNRQYVMSIFNGAPTANRDGSLDTDPYSEEDRYEEWTGAPPPETVFIFADDPACVGASCPPVACVDVNCGLTNFPNNPTRTFWSQESIE